MKRRLQAIRAFALAVTVALILSNPISVYAFGEAHCIKTVPSPAVCLTVDDGFNARSIQSILHTLKKNRVRCTFFVVGAFLTRPGYQALWQQAVRDGNEICYHTMKHQHVNKMTKSQIIADIAAWEKAAHKALGDSYRIPKFARFPGGSGSDDPRILKIYEECGYRIIRWNVDTLTGPESHGISIKRYVRGYASQGSIILTHFSGADASAMPGYIGWLKSKYKLERISDAFPPPAEPMPVNTSDRPFPPEGLFRLELGSAPYGYPVP